nr:acyl-homoserine-lactone synthase [Pseudomonas luteola]
MLTIEWGSRDSFTSSTLAAVGAFRYKIFVEQLGWKLTSKSLIKNQEFDQFDTNDAYYVIALENDTDICGFSRLTPTDKPNLLSYAFSQLCDGIPPADRAIFDMTRFAFQSHINRQHGIKLFAHSLKVAASLGAHKICGVVTPAVERYYQRHGVILRRLGKPYRIGNELLLGKL